MSADKERDSYLTETCNRVLLLLSLFTKQYILLDVEITSYPCTNSLGVISHCNNFMIFSIQSERRFELVLILLCQ